MPEMVMRVEDRSWSDGPRDESIFERGHIVVRARVGHWGHVGEAARNGTKMAEGKSFEVYTRGEVDDHKKEFQKAITDLRDELRKEFATAIEAISPTLFSEAIRQQVEDAVFARLQGLVSPPAAAGPSTEGGDASEVAPAPIPIADPPDASAQPVPPAGPEPIQ
jgi:hypothetical protein